MSHYTRYTLSAGSRTVYSVFTAHVHGWCGQAPLNMLVLTVFQNYIYERW